MRASAHFAREIADRVRLDDVAVFGIEYADDPLLARRIVRHLRKDDPAYPIEVAGIYDTDPQRAEAAREKGLRAYASAEDVFADAEVGAVLIATPNDVHAQYAYAAAQAGKHIICEKPIAMSVREAEKMYAAAQKAGVVLEVHQNRRWDDDFLTVGQLIKAGTIGQVYKIESRVVGANGIPGAWRKERAHGGGMMLDWGVHLIDQMLQLVPSETKSVYCEYSYIYGEEVDDGCELHVLFENGMRYDVVVATDCFRRLPRWQVYGTEGTATIEDWDLAGPSANVPINAGISAKFSSNQEGNSTGIGMRMSCNTAASAENIAIFAMIVAENLDFSRFASPSVPTPAISCAISFPSFPTPAVFRSAPADFTRLCSSAAASGAGRTCSFCIRFHLEKNIFKGQQKRPVPKNEAKVSNGVPPTAQRSSTILFLSGTGA